MKTLTASEEAVPVPIVLDTTGGGFGTVLCGFCSGKGGRDQTSGNCNPMLASPATTSAKIWLF